jgi:hypothetical protein
MEILPVSALSQDPRDCVNRKSVMAIGLIVMPSIAIYIEMRVRLHSAGIYSMTPRTLRMRSPSH